MSEQQSLGTLVQGIAQDLSALLRGEVELIKAELRDSARNAASGGGLLAAAGVTAFLGVIFLLLTLAWVLVALGLPVWAGFGIVTLLLVAVAVLLGVLGRNRLQAVHGPERFQASLEQTKAVLSRSTPDAG